jgi:ABC-type xylose transport system permease subunit
VTDNLPRATKIPSAARLTGSRRGRGLPDLRGIAAATAAAFATSAAYYITLAEPYQELLGTPQASMPAWTLLVELARTLALTSAMSALVARLDIVRASRALQVAVAAWTAFPATLMVGAVVHDGVPWGLAAIHGGDWLVKLCLVTVLLARFRASRQRYGAPASGRH